MTKLVYKLLRKVGLLKRISLTPKIKLNNKIFHIPVVNEVGYDNYINLSEPWMQHILARLFSQLGDQKAFLDVGVNLGQTLIKVKAIAPSIYYIGFEPNPTCVNYVNLLIKANNLINTEIIPVGISDKSSVLKLKLFSDSDADSSASIIEGYREESSVVKTFNVPVFKYSDIALDMKLGIGVIKIDVEGAELEVLKGFKDKIASDRPIILIEVLPAYNKQNLLRLSRQDNIQKLVKELNYKILRIIKNNGTFADVQEINDFGIHADLNLCEYILSPSESAENIKVSLSR